MSTKIDKISEKLGQIKKFLPAYLKEHGLNVEWPQDNLFKP